MTDQKANEYLNAFPKSERVNLETVYPGAGEEAIDLLHKILVFNPYFRLSIDECLEHPFFKKCRKSEKEQDAKDVIQFDWEKEHLDRTRLRYHFVEEMMFFKAFRQQELGN